MERTTRAVVDPANVQGLIMRGYNYPISRHLLFAFGDEAGGKSFLRRLRPRITSSVAWDPSKPKPEPLLNLGLTYQGLVAIGLEDSLRSIGLDPARTNPFPREFREPPDTSSLGDRSARNRPESWWNGRFATGRIHAIVHLYTQGDDAMTSIVSEVRGIAADAGVEELIANEDGTPLGGRALDDKKVHFGYRDGLGQPIVNWEDDPAQAPNKTDLRHFLLGYATPEIPSSPNPKDTGDLFRDCSYDAFRWLSQDVVAFERFLEQKGPELRPDLPLDEAKELLAAKLVGRWRDGTPLVLSPDRPDPSASTRDDFSYKDDPAGLRCPFTAHIRVTNPRDQTLDSIVDPVVPRLLRRGSSYGPELTPGGVDEVDRGLLGMFVCVSIDRQFHRVVQWMNATNFSPVFAGHLRGQDPLFGSRDVPGSSTDFLIPTEGGPVKIQGLTEFVRSRGTAYFLLPSLSTLDRLLR